MRAADSRFRCAALAVALILVGGLAVSGAAHATNGYFTHGYGTISKALAGAGVALPQDSMAAATNPAGMAFVGKRYDAGIAVFNPSREYTVTGNPSGFPGTFGLAPGTVQSDSNYFYVPYFGANWDRGNGSTLGFNLYGHGGMNTDYPTNTFWATTPTGVNLSQLFISGTWAQKIGTNQAFGITPVIVYQQFEIEGVGSFAPFSSDPMNLSNNGGDTSTGYGMRLGYLAQWTPKFSLGIAYQSKMSMGEFDSYAGLFAEQGGFDIPSSLTLGFAVKATPRFTFLIDLQEIYYTDVASVSNPFLPNLQQARLGDDEGAGFGWDDMTVLKLGFQWDAGNSWIWRFGYSTGDQPIPRTEVMFNILAPGVMEEHFTLGFTKQLRAGSAWNLSLMHAPSSSVTGPNPLEFPGAQEIELKMDQWDVELSYSWGF